MGAVPAPTIQGIGDSKQVFTYLEPKKDCPKWAEMLQWTETTVLQGGWPLFLHRMGVVLVNKNHFDFKDLMAFGMFILALLTFVFTFIK